MDVSYKCNKVFPHLGRGKRGRGEGRKRETACEHFCLGGLKTFKGPLQKSHIRDLSFILQIVQELAGNDNYLLLPLAGTL